MAEKKKLKAPPVSRAKPPEGFKRPKVDGKSGIKHTTGAHVPFEKKGKK